MSIPMDMPPGDMDLATLVHRCSLEVSRYYRRESSDDRYCLEIFRRALLQRDNGAWEIVYTQFYANVSRWFRSHVHREIALRYDAERSYIDEAFRRFWQWDHNQQQALEFTSLAGALRALHLCLNSAIMDKIRTYARPQEVPIPEYGLSDDPRLLVEDCYHQDDWWGVVESILTNLRERRVIYLLYYCGLKPREVIQQCMGEFMNEQEVYRLTRNAIDRLKRNADKLRWRLSEAEA